MASNAQETLYEIFAALAGGGGSIASGGLARRLTDAVSASAAASGPAKTQGGGAVSAVEDVLKSGLGLVPLVTTLFGLFGGGEETAPAPLVKYSLPATMNFDAAETSSGLAGVDRDQFGAVRPYEPTAVSTPATPQVNVTVQAMDARSFLDRSGDIAAAVRDAMLNLNSINDVVNEL